MRQFIYQFFFVIALGLTSYTSWAADFSVNRYVSNAAYHANSYWLESDKGIAVIDALMLRSDAKNLAQLVKQTGKPLKGVIITHAHFDHYGGLNMLRESLGYFPVYATKATVKAMKENHAATLQWAPDSHGDDYDKVMVKPDKIVKSGQVINIAGIALKIDELGPGESGNNIVIFQADQNILFSGDATLHNSHMYLGEGRSSKILEHLDYLGKTYGGVKLVYSGHGDPLSPAAVFKPEADYVHFIRSLAKAALSEGKVVLPEGKGFDKEILKTMVAEVISQYPSLGDYGLTPEYMVNSNIEAVLKELNK